MLSPIVPKYNVHDPYLNASTTVTVDGLDARSLRATVPHGAAAAHVRGNNATQASLCQFDFYDTFRAGADVVITVTVQVHLDWGPRDDKMMMTSVFVTPAPCRSCRSYS